MKQKKTLKLVAVISFMSLLISCSNDKDFSEVTNVDKMNSVQVVKITNDGQIVPINIRTKSINSETEAGNIALRFNTEEAYSKTLTELEDMSSQEKKNWESEIGSFRSLNSIYEEAMIYASDSLLDSEDSYKKFKVKYSKYLYFPEYKEDLGAYLPVSSNIKEVSSETLASVVNPKGLVVIGNKIENIRTIDQYQELQERGDAYYSKEINNEVIAANVLSSNNDWSNVSYVNPDDYKSYMLLKDNKQYIGNQYESGWRKGGKGKKLNFKFGRRYKDGSLVWHTEVSFRKHVWCGWVNYSSETALKGTIYYYENNSLIGEQAIEHVSSGSSSHDGYGPLQNTSYLGYINVPSLLTIPVYAYHFPEIRGIATIDYRGFYEIEHYSWKMTYKNSGSTNRI